MLNEGFPLTKSLIETVDESFPRPGSGDLKLFLVAGLASFFLIPFTLWGDVLNNGRPVELFKYHKK